MHNPLLILHIVVTIPKWFCRNMITEDRQRHQRFQRGATFGPQEQAEASKGN